MASENHPKGYVILQRIATIVGLMLGAALVLPTLGNVFLMPTRVLKAEEKVETILKDQASLRQIVEEHSKEINGLNNKIERLENVITNGNQRNESSMKDLFIAVTKLSVTTDIIKDSVATALDIANGAKTKAINAEIRADKALDDVEAISRGPTK